MNRWKILAAFLVAGLAGVVWLAPQQDRITKNWRPQQDAAAVEEQFRQLAKSLGFEISGWSVHVGPHVSDLLNETRVRYGTSPVLAPFTPFRTRVIARSPDGKSRIKAEYQNNGVLTLLEAAPPVGAFLQAESFFREQTGPDSLEFTVISRGAKGRDGEIWSWERAAAGGRTLLARFELLLKEGRLARFSYQWEITDQAVEGARRADRQAIAALLAYVSFLTITLITVACWIFFQRMTVRKDHIRFPVPIVGAFCVLLLLALGSGNRLAEALMGNEDPNRPIATILIGLVAEWILRVMVIYVLLAAGYAMVPASERRAWIGLQLLSRWQWRTRPVGQELVAGLAAGIPALALLYFVGWLGQAQLRLSAGEFLYVPWPALTLVDEFFNYDIAAGFALAMPLAARLIRWEWLRWTVILGLFVPYAIPLRRLFQPDVTLDFFGTIAFMVVVAMVYRFFGLLAALITPLGLVAVQHIAVQLILGDGFAPSGWRTLACLTAIAIGGLIIAVKGHSPDPEAVAASMDPTVADLERSQRDRLNAEFAVARQAQQNMLPASPPVIPGLSVAGSCRPALEVGGDLFDYPRLPDGRWGFCVADVSGKGVPASVYMTLTKGLLTAETRHSSAIDQVASQLNRHLHAACKNKMFVTMALGAYDPETRRFDHVRAGQNPLLLRRAATGLCEYVQPKGLALGLVKALSFDRALQEHSLTLEPGDIVVLYSDGLTEAMNPQREQFGEDRLQEVVNQHGTGDAVTVHAGILRAVDHFIAGAEPHDDLTVVVLRVF